MSTRFTVFLQAAERRLRETAQAVGEALEHGGENGTGHEATLREELTKLLPMGYHITSGFILGSEPTISAQIDAYSSTTRCITQPLNKM